jgi:D-tyrosyl-tRNA(Tyr) deacylase
VLQRISRALVWVDGEAVGEIGHGWLVFLGVRDDDTTATKPDVFFAEKMAHLRCFDDAYGETILIGPGRWRAVLLVSQFTLFADTRQPGSPTIGAMRRVVGT